MTTALSADISQLLAVVIGDSTDTRSDASQVQVLSVYQGHTTTSFSSQDQGIVVAETKPTTYLSQINIISVWKIKEADPMIRAWTFTLDGHDFYVLQLGSIETLVYDVYSEQWMTWADGNFDIWKLNTGRNWIQSGDKPDTYGSNVLAGDYNDGTLYLFDPTYPYDDQGNTTENVFYRVAQSFIPTRAAGKVPVYSIDVYGSLGYTTTAQDVTLQYSDDNGTSYTTAAVKTVPINEPNFRLEWRGMGSFTRPGRLFKIIDSGALHRLDGMEANIGQQGSEST